MTWQKFQHYLESNIIFTTETGKTVIQTEAIIKHLGGTDNQEVEEKATQAIVNLLASLDATINNTDQAYQLPEYQELVWEKLVPNQALGVKTSNENKPLANEVYYFLGRLFAAWKEEEQVNFDEEETPPSRYISPYQSLEKWLDNLVDGNFNLKDESGPYTTTNFPPGEKFSVAMEACYESVAATIINDSDYHQLPFYAFNKKWSELCPRESTYFGKSINNTPLPPASYELLGTIYHAWQVSLRENNEQAKQAALADQLYEQIKQGQPAEEMEQLLTKSFLANVAINEKQAILTKWKKWLATYHYLAPEQQQSLKHREEEITKIVKTLEGSLTTHTTTNYWNIAKQVAWYGGGLLVIILVLGWLKSKTK